MTTTTPTGAPALPAAPAPRTTRPLRRAPAGTAPPGRRDPRRPGPSRTAARPAPPHHWFAERLLDVLSGRRPAAWMLGHTAGAAAWDRLWELASRGVLRPPPGRPAPRVHRSGHRVPAPGVQEVYALIGCGDARRALAFRLEYGDDHRWRCAAVETGPSW